MILSDIRKSVRNRLDDTSFDQATVDEGINFFVNDLLTDHRIRFMEAEDDLYVSANDTFVDLPDDTQTLISLHVTAPQVYNIMNQYTEYGDFMKNYPGYMTYAPGQVYTWTDYANGMRLAAPALTDTTIHVDYLREPVTMVADTDVCEIPDVYKHMVVLGGLIYCMERNEDYSEASTERANLAPLVKTFIANEGRGQIKLGPTIIRSNRRSSLGSYNASRDF